jgi:hypothetical protein
VGSVVKMEALSSQRLDEKETVKVKVPLIEGCPHTDSVVYIDPDGVIYDATLNKIDINGDPEVSFWRMQASQYSLFLISHLTS